MPKMVSPLGYVANIEDKDLKFAVESGWLDPTPENLKAGKIRRQADTLGGQALAGAEGILRGVTGRYANKIEGALGAEPENIEARAKAHPFTAGAGEVVGGLALPVAAAAALPVSLGVIGGAAAAGGLAGAVHGALETTYDVVEENKPFTAERIAQEIVLGTAGGAIGGAVAKGVGTIFKAARELPAFAERQAVKGLGASSTALKNLDSREMTGKLGRKLLDTGALSGDKAARATRLAAQEAENVASASFGPQTLDRVLTSEASAIASKATEATAQPGIIEQALKGGGPLAMGAAAFQVGGGPVGAATYLASRTAAKYATDPAAVARAADWLGARKVVQSLASQADKVWHQKAISLLGASGGVQLGSPDALPDPQDYGKLAEVVRDDVENPERSVGLASAAVSDISRHYPDIADLAVMQAQKGQQYLADALPKGPLKGPLDDQDWEPSLPEKTRWLDKWRAVHSPASVLANPTKESVEALQKVYPATYQKFVESLQDNLAGKALSLQQKLKIAYLLGPSASTVTQDSFVATMQRVHAPANDAPEEGQQNSARTAVATRMHLKQIAQSEMTDLNSMQER